MIPSKTGSFRAIFTTSFQSVLYPLVMICPVLLLSGCEQTAPEPGADQAAAVEKMGEMIYRPKVKLVTTDPDPAVLKKYLQAREHMCQERLETARKQFMPLAEAGYTDAQLAIAYTYMTPTHIKSDREQSVRWMILSADGGNAMAQWSLGVRDYHGSHKPVSSDYFIPDWVNVNYYLLAAAEQGLDIAQLEIADRYRAALGDEMNEQAIKANGDFHYAKAYMWYILAAQRYAQYDGMGVDLKELMLGARGSLIETDAHNHTTKAWIAVGERMAKEWNRTHPDAYLSDGPLELYPDPLPCIQPPAIIN